MYKIHFIAGSKDIEQGYYLSCGIFSPVFSVEYDSKYKEWVTTQSPDEGYNTFNIDKVTCKRCKNSKAYREAVFKHEMPLFFMDK